MKGASGCAERRGGKGQCTDNGCGPDIAASGGDDQKESTQVFGGAGSPAASVRDFGND